MAYAVNGFMYGVVTHIVDPSNFFLRLGSSEKDLSEFDTFAASLNASLHNLPVGLVDEVNIQSMVLAYCSAVNIDGLAGAKRRTHSRQWRRATVSRIDPEKMMFDVYCVDYGNSEIVPATDICQVVPLDVQQYPYQLFHCALAGINPIARSWPQRAVTLFKKLVHKKVLRVTLMSYDNHTFSNKVAIYYSDEQSIAHQLLDAETGLATDEDVAVFATDIVPVLTDVLPGTKSEAYIDALDWNDSDIVAAVPELDGVATDDTCLRGARIRSHGDASSTVSDDVCAGALSDAKIVVPGFDLSSLIQQRQLSAEQMTREKEEEVQAQNKANVQHDFVKYATEMEKLHMGLTDRASDLLIGQYFSDDSSTTLSDTEAKVDYSLSRKKYHGDIKEQIPQRVRSISNPYHTVSKPSELDAPPASPPIITKCDVKCHSLGDVKNVESSQSNASVSYLHELPICQPSVKADQHVLQKILKDMLNQALQQPDPNNMEALLSEIFYPDTISEEQLMGVLQSCCDKYVKVPSRRANTYHTNFASVLCRMLFLFDEFPLLKGAIAVICLTFAEQWVVFNKKGVHKGAMLLNQEKVYLDCLEIVFQHGRYVLWQADTNRFKFIMDAIRGKVLDVNVNHFVRDRLLCLLIGAADVDTKGGWSNHGFKNGSGGLYPSTGQAITSVDKACQVGDSLMSGCVSEEAVGGYMSVTVEASCQTDGDSLNSFCSLNDGGLSVGGTMTPNSNKESTVQGSGRACCKVVSRDQVQPPENTSSTVHPANEALCHLSVSNELSPTDSDVHDELVDAMDRLCFGPEERHDGKTTGRDLCWEGASKFDDKNVQQPARRRSSKLEAIPLLSLSALKSAIRKHLNGAGGETNTNPHLLSSKESSSQPDESSGSYNTEHDPIHHSRDVPLSVNRDTGRSEFTETGGLLSPGDSLGTMPPTQNQSERQRNPCALSEGGKSTNLFSANTINNSPCADNRLTHVSSGLNWNLKSLQTDLSECNENSCGISSVKAHVDSVVPFCTGDVDDDDCDRKVLLDVCHEIYKNSMWSGKSDNDAPNNLDQSDRNTVISDLGNECINYETETVQHFSEDRMNTYFPSNSLHSVACDMPVLDSMELCSVGNHSKCDDTRDEHYEDVSLDKKIISCGSSDSINKNTCQNYDCKDLSSPNKGKHAKRKKKVKYIPLNAAYAYKTAQSNSGKTSL